MESVELVDVLKALADPILLRIIQELTDGDPHAKADVTLSCGFEVQKTTLSHHYKELREAGITRTVVTGRTHAIQMRRAELDAKFPGLIDALTGHTTA